MIKTKAQACIQWIQEYYKDNPDGKAIIGISGGKDSTVAAALCVEALGADRVIGVLMPQGIQKDIKDSYDVCRYLNLEPFEVNIGAAYQRLAEEVLGDTLFPELPPIVTTNAPARLRMTVLYMVAGLFPNSRVVNTCNRSEDYVGYSTKYGDAAGDFSPLGNLTVREVLEIGDELGLPKHLVHKTPSDGMCGKSDEDNLGFTYNELDNYILETSRVREETKEKIERLHKSSRHKYQPMPMFDPDVLYIDNDQMTIDDILPRRGLRAKSGIMDDYADGGLVDPSVTASAMAGNAIMTGLDIAAPAAANNVNLDSITSISVEPHINLEQLQQSIWKTIRADGIRGI